MYEVDWVLDRLAAELDRRDTEIARLRAQLVAQRQAGRAGGDEGQEPPIWAGGRPQ
jgi:hypothetical protein